MQTLGLAGGIVGVDAEQCARNLGKGDVELHLKTGGTGGVDVDVMDDGGVLNVVPIFGMEEVEYREEGEEGYHGTRGGLGGELGGDGRVAIEGSEFGQEGVGIVGCGRGGGWSAVSARRWLHNV